jgi:hypothetical protein
MLPKQIRTNLKHISRSHEQEGAGARCGFGADPAEREGAPGPVGAAEVRNVIDLINGCIQQYFTKAQTIAHLEVRPHFTHCCLIKVMTRVGTELTRDDQA